MRARDNDGELRGVILFLRFRRAAAQIQILSTHCVMTPRDSVGDDGCDMTTTMTMRARVGGRAGYRIDVLDDADGVSVRRA